MQSFEQRADEMLRAAGGSMAVWSQRNALRRMILAEDKVDDVQSENDRLKTLVAQIHAIAKNGLDGGDDYEAMREIERLSA